VDLTLERKAFPAAPAKPQLQQFRRNCEGPSLVRRMAKPPAPARHPLSVGFCSKPGPPVGD
jgi:hypothetical protein